MSKSKSSNGTGWKRTKERVLVCPAEFISLDKFQNCILTGDSAEEVWYEILAAPLTFEDKDKAETNPSLKQLIPYVYVTRGKEVLTYWRTKKGGEGRLHDKRSLGIGGHVNDTDSKDPKYAFPYGVDREIKEEIGIDAKQHDLIFKGLLYDDSDEVGQVHLGVIYNLKVEFDTKLKFNDDSLADHAWVHGLECKKEKKFENWSRAVAQNII